MDLLLACRIPCDCKDKNLSILVEEESKRPSNLVLPTAVFVTLNPVLPCASYKM